MIHQLSARCVVQLYYYSNVNITSRNYTWGKLRVCKSPSVNTYISMAAFYLKCSWCFFVKHIQTHTSWLLLYKAFSLKLFFVAMETLDLAVHLSVTPLFVPNYNFFCPGKWNHLPPPTLKPSLLFRHRCAAAATAFFFFLSLFSCVPIQESLSHADTLFCSIYVSLLPLWSKSITDTLCFHASDDYSPCLCLYWYCFRWESCMLSGSVWGIVGNRLWQTERELEL